MAFGIEKLAAENVRSIKNTNGFPFMHLKNGADGKMPRAELLKWAKEKSTNGMEKKKFARIHKFLVKNAKGSKNGVHQAVTELFAILQKMHSDENAGLTLIHMEDGVNDAELIISNFEAAQKGKKRGRKKIEAD